MGRKPGKCWFNILFHFTIQKGGMTKIVDSDSIREKERLNNPVIDLVLTDIQIPWAGNLIRMPYWRNQDCPALPKSQ
jgi:hypothetical protein